MNGYDVIKIIEEKNFNCNKIHLRTFKKGDIITSYIENRKQICILKSGSAELIRTDFNGDLTTLEYFKDGDLFGEFFYLITSNTQLNVVAKDECNVFFINYDFLISKCSKECIYHENIVNLILEKIARRMIILTNHIEMLTKKSIRDKLLSYFNTISFQKSSKTFTLPVSLTSLATYLNIDRSAMMREIKYLEEEGFIKREKKKITIR